MTIYLNLPELLYAAERAIGTIEIRDVGLLESALARPQATAFGDDAYSTLLEKGAAFVHSLARNHALVDGNKRLALAGLLSFLGMNDHRLTLDNGRAYDLIVDIARGAMDDVGAIAERLAEVVEPHTF